MRISSASAQQIVNEISGIVKQNVNIMDSNGYIIASTNRARIGDFHEGAKKIVDERLDEYYVTRDAETATTRAGLNLPIIIDGETIGVVGITGEYEHVYNYGQIVKKVTEILVRESYAREQERFDKKIESRFLEDWILGSGFSQGQAFVERGLALHIDIKRPRRVMVLRLDDFQKLSGTGEGQMIIENVESELRRFICREPENLFLRLTTKQVCLVTPRSDERMCELATEIFQLVKNKYGEDMMAGIDSSSSGTSDLRNAYIKANKASHACHAPSQRIMLYNQIDLELFNDDIPGLTKKEYLMKIFSGCSFEEIQQWITVLEAYFSAEGSISLAAEKLYIHKNTLQYKLNKLAAMTKYDVRLPSNSAVFYMAIVFFRDVRKELLVLNK